MTSFIKDPEATLDYLIDWAPWLTEAEGDTISTSAWAVVPPVGLTVAASPAPSNTPTTATVWLSGGTVDRDYVVTNHITTAGGRANDRSILIRVRAQ